MLLFAACCFPGEETYRGATTVHAPGFSGTVVACTWSHWGAPDCEGRAVVEGAGEFAMPAHTSGGPFVVIFGEAPLMQSMFIACDQGRPVGARFIPWEDPVPKDLDLGPTTGGILGHEAHGMDEAAFQAWLTAQCPWGP